MKSLARWGSLPLLAAPLGSWALTLGDIEPNSYLNQPLNAEIALTATPEELSSLRVSLASVDTFLNSGIDYPAFLATLDFDLTQNAQGRNVIRVTSPGPIAEPFVTIVVEASYARGTSRREYSILLDPPLFVPAEAAEPAPIAAPVTRDPEPAVSGGPIQRQTQPQPVTQPPAQPAQPQPVTEPIPVTPSQASDYTVQAGDTLWAIASQARPNGVSMNQAMMSIFEANPAAFDGNINRLRRGAILRIPQAAELGSMAVAAANAEVARQIDAWRNQVETAPQLVLLPPAEDAVADSAAAGAELEAAVEAEASASGLDDGPGGAAEAVADNGRLLDIQSEELSDLQNQLGDAADAETAAAEAAAAEEVAADEPLFVDDLEAAGDDVAEEPVAEAADEPAEEQPVAAAPAQQPAVVQNPSPSLLDQVMEWVRNPIFAISGGVLVVLLAALAFLRRRRGDEDDVTGQWEALEAEIDEEVDLAATARIRAQALEPNMVVIEGSDHDATAEEPHIDTGTREIEALNLAMGTDGGTAEIESLDLPDLDSEAAPAPVEDEPWLADQTMSSQTVINLDQADPIAEADFHMAYGLYDQAADLITTSLQADPDNRALKLKLLEVYFVWGNKDEFLAQANSLRSDIGDGPNADWDKVVIMGKQICPDEPLFSGATAAASEVDLDLDSSGSAAGLDFAFEEEDDSVDLDFGIVEEDDMSLEPSGPAPATDDDDMLDIGAQTQAGLEAALLDIDDEAEKTQPGDEVSDPESTMESPTIETESADFADALTIESPTIDSPGPDAPTVETPTIETPAAEVGDTVEHVRPAAAAGGSGEMTAELEIDDLGLDIGDLDDLTAEIADLPGDSATGATGVFDSLELSDDSDDDDEADLLTATGVTQVLDPEAVENTHTGTAVLGDEDATMMAPDFGDDDDDDEVAQISTEVLEQPAANFDPAPPETEDDLDLNLDDVSSALEGGDTVEQPIASRFDSDSDLDLDVGADVQGDDEPTGTEEVALDPQTMTEVGTKLDLARAYIDMGDPEGARSILEEVMTEGDAGQRSEAQTLIDALPA